MIEGDNIMSQVWDIRNIDLISKKSNLSISNHSEVYINLESNY